jgi:hypothetical protein
VSNNSSENNSETQKQKQEQTLSEVNSILKKERPPLPYKDIFKESDLQVKIADLGNACWTVCDSK